MWNFGSRKVISFSLEIMEHVRTTHSFWSREHFILEHNVSVGLLDYHGGDRAEQTVDQVKANISFVPEKSERHRSKICIEAARVLFINFPPFVGAPVYPVIPRSVDKVPWGGNCIELKVLPPTDSAGQLGSALRTDQLLWRRGHYPAVQNLLHIDKFPHTLPAIRPHVTLPSVGPEQGTDCHLYWQYHAAVAQLCGSNWMEISFRFLWGQWPHPRQQTIHCWTWGSCSVFQAVVLWQLCLLPQGVQQGGQAGWWLQPLC